LKGPTKGSVRFTGFKIFKPIWTERLYPFQIVRQALRDRPDALHIDFTITEFSSQYLNMLFFPLLVLLLKTLGMKVVLTVHDVLSRDVLRELFGPRSLKGAASHFALIFYLKFLAFSDTIIVHLKILRETLIREFLVSPEKIVLVPFGVGNVPRVAPTLSWQNKFSGGKVVLALGVVAPRKGLEYLVQGFSNIASKHPDSVLVLAGPRDTRRPEYLNRIIKMATSIIDIDQFYYTGYLDETSANSLIAVSRVVALSYLYACATTSILYWIMAHRKPVVVSAIDTLQEELEGYDSSLFVGPRDSAQIAKALDRVLSDDELAARAKGFMEVKASLQSWSRVAMDIVDAYRLSSGSSTYNPAVPISRGVLSY